MKKHGYNIHITGLTNVDLKCKEQFLSYIMMVHGSRKKDKNGNKQQEREREERGNKEKIDNKNKQQQHTQNNKDTLDYVRWTNKSTVHKHAELKSSSARLQSEEKA